MAYTTAASQSFDMSGDSVLIMNPQLGKIKAMNDSINRDTLQEIDFSILSDQKSIQAVSYIRSSINI